MSLNDRTAIEIFRAIAKEFESRDQTEVEIFLEIASTFVGPTVWGEKYNTGLAYMAAHLMSVSARAGAAGSVTSEHVGSVSVSYSAPSATDDSLATTSYGATFKSLRRLLVMTPVVRC